MGKVLFCIVAVVASLVLVESLSCNTCSYGLVGVCLNQGNETCSENVTDCYTLTITFPAVPSFSGISTQGCAPSSFVCNRTINNTVMGAAYDSNITCCKSDFCNIVSRAPTTKMTFSAAICGALLTSFLGGIM